MKHSAAIRAVPVRFLKSSVSSPQNRGPPGAVYRSLQIHPSVRLVILGGWDLLWNVMVTFGGPGGGHELAFEGWDNVVRVDCASAAVGR